MKHLPLRQKLLWITSALFMATVAILSGSLWYSVSTQTAALSADVRQTVNEQISAKLRASAGLYGEKMASFINEAYRVPNAIGAILEDSTISQTMSRDAVQAAVAAVLKDNDDISAIYAQFEANGFDGRDAEFVFSQAQHSVEDTGSLEIYFYRDENGVPVQQRVEDAEEKYLSEKDEFGIREAEWYLCAKDTGKPCLLEPYLEEIDDGYSVMMTSLTAPVMRDGTFRGVIGIDVNLPVFQTLIDDLSASLFQGQAKVTLLSDMGLIVAASHYDTRARPLKDVMPSSMAKEVLSLNHGKQELLTDESLIATHPIKVPLSGSQWLLMIDVPKEIAFAKANQVDSSMKAMANSLGQLMLMVGLAVAVTAIALIALFVRSIVAPLQRIQGSVHQLASAEGDLTQTLEVNNHAELIALGNGFNRFIGKLHGLISELKNTASASREESVATADIAQQTKHSVHAQNAAIDNVATAINQMQLAASEVAQTTEQTAARAKDMSHQVSSSRESLTEAVRCVTQMTKESEQAKQAVVRVAKSSGDISKILEVISNISEQTNLLALNAAIEAARAGAQGRGFAVVADEVRALASKTQASTNDISALISTLQREVNSAHSIIDNGVTLAQRAEQQTEGAFTALSNIVEQIDEVSQQVTQIAAAAEEQNVVTEEVSRIIVQLTTSASELMRLAEQAQSRSASLSGIVSRQESQLAKLKT